MTWLEAVAVPQDACVVARSEPVESRVIRQLLEALLFEGLVAYRAAACMTGWQWLHFSLGELQGRCKGQVRGFGRIRLNVQSLCLTCDGKRVCLGLEGLVERLPASPERRLVFLQELEATVRNTRACRRIASRRELDAEALDSALHEGHPYHPCFKTRLGFSDDDQVNYGPESGNTFRLKWLAVPLGHRQACLPCDEEAFWRRELGPETAQALRVALRRAGGNPRRHVVLPVHPWQWQLLREGALRPALARGEIIDLGVLGDRYRASQSLRSLFNASRPGQSCVKLSLGIGNTSSRRHLVPHSVPSAPAISRWLRQTIDSDPCFSRDYPLRLLEEYAGLLYTGHPEHPTEREALAGELGAIWRDGIASRLGEGERAVPLNALFAVEADGRPFIQPWIERHGIAAWFEAVIRSVVLPVWHLLAAHGIAVEAHAQNGLLVVREGWPVALLLRDFHDSVEYVEAYLPKGGGGPDLAARQAIYDLAPDDRYYRMGEVEALRELMMDTLFVFHLSELALLMERHYCLPEAEFWSQVNDCLAAYARHHPELSERLARLGHRRHWIAAEALLTHTLRGPEAPECHHCVPNTLADADVFDNQADHRG
ncbi:IucA/IucC family protein [Halomonas sp. BC04]|uniref:IucA/IucC family protein n=1 Tax=Halomonas sp. BC04 TaxID=1403540 RepID=UPI0003ED5CED|nr:IucA/IucC family protein [Halomonas sp. BC04]EWH00379.1 rhizobactin siderophore biosynthesis protein RhsF [Halomonas sp. BC04]